MQVKDLCLYSKKVYFSRLRLHKGSGGTPSSANGGLQGGTLQKGVWGNPQ